MRSTLRLVAAPEPRTIPDALYGRPFEVYESANPKHFVTLNEVNEHRALIFGAIQLRVSAEKCRVRPAPTMQPRAALASLGVA